VTSTLRTADVEHFRSVLTRRVGLHFEDAKLGFLAEVLERRLERTGESPQSYSARLERPGGDRGELRELAREVTVAETYFFRHFDQFRAFSEVALPARVEARGGVDKVRVLSAGCATGEEAYSLAIVVREHRAISASLVAIHAVDLNPVGLERAARGRYSDWALRETPETLRERWFTREGREHVLDQTVRSSVTFEEQNLAELDSDRFRVSAFDVVFFRNVLMYFTPEVARAVVARLSRSLVPGGYLFLGHAENLRGLSNDFHLCHTHDTFYYQKKTGAELAAGTVHHVPAAVHDIAAPVLGDSSTSWVETIQNAADRIRLLSERNAPPVDTARSEEPSGVQHALELLKSERFDEALAQLDAIPASPAADPDVLLLRASLLTHSGDLKGAEAVCSELLVLDDLNAGAHYLLALCREGRGDLAGAVDQDRIAVYLDERFAMPRLHLGLMARKVGDKARARRELEQAIDLLAGEEPSRLLLFGGGFGRDGLMALCRGELERLGGAA
jgi:chemotaxis protein methyltransferase CheR